MKALLLTFDVEEFDWPLERGHVLDAETQLDVTAQGLSLLLPLLARHSAAATFFVTGRFASARPQLLRELVAAGHEAAVHGLAHADDYATLTPDAALARLREARKIVDAAAQTPSTGVRTPRLRPCSAAILRQAGFAYDASAHPTWIPGRYNGLSLPRTPWREDGLLRLPISVLPAIRLPVSWLWYRLAGKALGGVAARAAGFGAPYVHLYFHAWEAVPVQPFGIPAPLAWRTGPGFIALIDLLLTNARGRYAVTTAGAYARTLENAMMRSRRRVEL